MPHGKKYKVQITVQSVANGCSIGLKEGKSWLITNRTPGGMCRAAFATMYPHIRTLRHGGGGDKGFSRVSCPDPKHCVVFEVKRLDEVKREVKRLEE